MVYKGVVHGFKTVILFCDGDSGGNHLRRCPETPPDPAAFKRTDETVGRGSRMPAL